jgi:predicted  nucleic acid-binding Zn-ribbon protein
MISKTILSAQYEALVQLQIEKINIAESIKLIKDNLKDEGMESADIAALVKIAAAKAKEDLEGLNTQTDKLKEMLEMVA